MFLSVVVFLPTTATAQFFARQKVVVWEVFDRNNDVKVAEGTKVEIQQYLKEALNGSENYEPYMESIERVNQWLQTQNLPKSPANIAKAVKGKATALKGENKANLRFPQLLGGSLGHDAQQRCTDQGAECGYG